MFPSRVVIDTGVLISRMLQPNSPPAQAVRIASEKCTLLISHYLISELETVLKRSKFQRYITLNSEKMFSRCCFGSDN